jgi:predicted nucleic acid-binding protein
MSIVIDANIAIAWFRPTPSKLADAALEELSRQGAMVPGLWRCEVQDVLRRLSDTGHLKIPVEDALEEIRQLPISIDADTPFGLFGNELALARRHALSVYDAAYLDVSLRHHMRLATIDKRLAAAAKLAGLSF